MNSRNIGFYIPIVSEEDINMNIFNSLNTAVQNGDVRDATVFFNDLAFNPVTPKFSMMNASEIWSFTGNLLSTSLDGSLLAMGIVNKFDLFHVYRADANNDFFKLLMVSEKVKVVTMNDTDTKEFKRITGQDPVIQFEDFSIKSILEGIKDE
jgi:hypothetical protein